MTVVSFPISAADPSAGDAYGLKARPNSSAPGILATQLLFGLDVSGKISFPWAAFMRFELDIPDGSAVNGVLLNLVAAVTGGPIGSAVNLEVGILDPNHANVAPMIGPLGIADPFYVDQASLPISEWGNGVFSDPTVWWSGVAPPPVSHSITGQDTDTSFGDGIPSHTPTPGMLASILDYLASNSSIKGSGVGPGIPLVFMIHAPGLWSGAPKSLQSCWAYDNLTSQPTFDVDYTAAQAAQSGPISARGVVQSAVSARSSITQSVSGIASTRPAVSARASLRPATSARPSVRPAVSSRSKTI